MSADRTELAKRLLLLSCMLFLSTAASAEQIDLFYDVDLSIELDKNSFAPSETVSGKIVLLNRESFPIPEAYAVVHLVQGEKFYYPSQKSDADNIFLEQKISGINLSPTSRETIDFSIELPKDLKQGSYRLDFYAKEEKPLMAGVPHLFASPKTVEINVANGSGNFPQAKILRTKTKFHNFLGQIGPGINPNEEISNSVFITNTSNTELKNLELFTGLCEWDDTACSKFLSEDTAKIDSLKPGEKKAVTVNLVSPAQPDAYAIRIELRDSEKRLLSLYRNRSVVYGGTAKIHKLFINDFFFDRGENANITMLLGPSPDHWKKAVFENFEAVVSVTDLSSGKEVFAGTEKIAQIGKNYESDFLEKKFDFSFPIETGLFKVCGTVVKGSEKHEEFCFTVDSSKFKKRERFSELIAEYSYNPDSLNISFFLVDPKISSRVNASYVLLDISTNSVLGEGRINSVPAVANFPAIGAGNYTLLVNNFLTEKQSRIDIAIGEQKPAVFSPTCSDLGGFACSTVSSCSGNILKASDISVCCAVQCSEEKPVIVSPETPSFILGSNIVFFVAVVVAIAFLLFLIKRRKNKQEKNYVY